MTTIYEVSKLAGVSLATVSRVINKNNAVSPKTREKVLQAMTELGYRPNAIAQSLASNRSNSIGVLVSHLDSPFFGQMMVGIEDELRKEGKQVLFAAGNNLESMEKSSIEFLRSRFCDGLIIHSEQTDDDYMQALTASKIPVVVVNRRIPVIEEMCIILDNQKGGYMATEFVISQGHKNIAYLAGPDDKQDAMDRLLGFRRAMQDHRVKYTEQNIVFGNYGESSGREGLDTILERGIQPSVLVCANDEMASGAMKRARELNIDIPTQLSIVGYDDTSFATYLYPQLTTINNPIGEMGKMAARVILNKAYNYKYKISNYFEPELIIRQSVHKK